MTETQREPVPRNDAGERDTAMAFLRFARSCALKKADGLDEEQLRRVLVGSGTSILGLVQHLTDGETWWFGYHVDGAEPATEWDFSMEVSADRSPQTVLDGYRAAIRRSDAIIDAAADLDAQTARTVDGETRTLRWVIAHVTSETARHAGHADIIRELIDGTTGR
jgi:hypothetical protein